MIHPLSASSASPALRMAVALVAAVGAAAVLAGCGSSGTASGSAAGSTVSADESAGTGATSLGTSTVDGPPSSIDGAAPSTPGALSGATTASTGAASNSAAVHTSYPVEVTNCGRTLHFDKAPTRIVSGWTSSTELLLALGAGEQIVGQYNTASGTPRAPYVDQEKKIPVLGESAPTKEALLAAHPDLIWADGDYLFDGKQLPTVAQLNAEGIQVMILSGFCTDDATRAKVTDVFTDLTSLGTILDRQPAATLLAAQLRDKLDQAAAAVGGRDPIPVAMVSTYDKTIYAFGGVYTDIARLAGASNIYAEALPPGKYYNAISVEDITRQNPSTLVYLLSGSETPAAAQSYLAATLPTVEAVKSGRVIYLAQDDSTNLAGVDGVVALAAALHP